VLLACGGFAWHRLLMLFALLALENLLTRSRRFASIDETLPLDTLLLLGYWLGLALWQTRPLAEQPLDTQQADKHTQQPPRLSEG
jgi:hypothetical protein